MICKKGKGPVLRRGIAVFLMLLMVATAGPAMFSAGSTVYAEDQSGGTARISDEIPAETADGEEGERAEPEEGDSDIEMTLTPAADSTEASEGAVLFAAEPAVNKKVKLSYAGYVHYEKGKTHNFRISCDGKTEVAYCIEPKASAPKNGSYTAEPCNLKLLGKALYYSYGYPGFEEKTAAFLKENKMKSCYGTAKGKYAIGHMLLSYVYDNMSSKTDAFKGVSSGTKATVKKLLSSMESWPDPEEASSISFSPASVTASWNSDSKLQETPVISLKGSADNSLEMEVPEGTNLIKNNSEKFESGTVTMSGGDSFKLTAPESKSGRYTSPEMESSREIFRPYLIESSKKQDIAFATSTKSRLSYSVSWGASKEETPPEPGTPPEGETPPEPETKTTEPGLKTEAVEKESASHQFFSKGKAVIVDTVTCSGLIPGKEYRIAGRLMDRELGTEIPSVCHERTFTAERDTMELIVEFEFDSDKYAGRSAVVFEKLYSDGKVIAVHEDLNDREQTVKVKEKEKENEKDKGVPPTESEESPGNQNGDRTKSAAGGENFSDSPVTADDMKLILPISLIILSLLAAGGLLVFRREND